MAKDAKGHGSEARGGATAAHQAGVAKVGRGPVPFNEHFSVEKGKSHSNIYDAKSGEYLTQLRNKEVAGWLNRSTEGRRKDVEAEASRRGYRLQRVNDYLAKRAARPPQAKQLTLF